MPERLITQATNAPDHGLLDVRPFQSGWPQLPQ
jgi:hypothetical protein